MGACTFYNVETGKDIHDAFDNAVEYARHEHGHGGYTGTIAEKTSFQDITNNARFIATLITKLTERKACMTLAAQRKLDSEDINRIDYGATSDRMKLERSRCATYIKVLKQRKVTADKARAIANTIEMFDMVDKWGPALAIRYTENRKQYFAFFGLASS